MLETVIVVAIVVVAAALLGRRILAALSPRPSTSCGEEAPSCSGCASGCSQPIQIRRRGGETP